jgi:nucleoid-associated protein YgaU
LRSARRALLVALAMAWVAPAAADATATSHRVEPGDTLTSIALETLGDASLWPAIYLANRDQIKDPSRVYPGQLLSIPRVPPPEREAVRREAEELSRRPEAPTAPTE